MRILQPGSSNVKISSSIKTTSQFKLYHHNRSPGLHRHCQFFISSPLGPQGYRNPSLTESERGRVSPSHPKKCQIDHVGGSVRPTVDVVLSRPLLRPEERSETPVNREGPFGPITTLLVPGVTVRPSTPDR